MKTRTDELYVYDIRECCDNIQSFTAGVSEEDFSQNRMLQDAIVRNIEVIGEAAKNLSEELCSKNPQVSWREIMRMRDKIVHHYFRLKLDVIWQTVIEDIPKLKPEIDKILNEISQDD